MDYQPYGLQNNRSEQKNEDHLIVDTFEEIGLDDELITQKNQTTQRNKPTYRSYSSSDSEVPVNNRQSNKQQNLTQNRTENRRNLNYSSESDYVNQNDFINKSNPKINLGKSEKNADYSSSQEISEDSYQDYDKDDDFIASDKDDFSESESEPIEDSSDEDYDEPKERSRNRSRSTKTRSKANNDIKYNSFSKKQSRKSNYDSNSSDGSEYGKSSKTKGGIKKRKTITKNGTKSQNRYGEEWNESHSDDSFEKPTRISSRSTALPNYSENAYQFSDDSDSDLEKSKNKGKNKIIQPIIDEPGIEDIIESVKDYRLQPNAESDDISNTQNLEFYVKWKGWSYRHATWESYDVLRDFKGFKRVENFFKSTVMYEYSLINDIESSRETIDQLNINKEINREIIKEYQLAERIVTERPSQDPADDPGAVEYLVKWQRQPYNACTWEASTDVANDFPDLTDAYLDRTSLAFIPSKSSNMGRNRPTFKRIYEQPKYLIGGELRDYQLTSLNWMAHLWSKNENGILADEMGLGKTVQTISFMSYLFHSMNLYGPFLVVVPLSTIGSWQKELAKWAPDMNVIAYTEDGRSRSIIREHEFWIDPSVQEKVKFNILLTTYELVLKDRDYLGNIKWAFMAVDEAHRLKNIDSQLHEALFSFKVQSRLLITGTPLQNSVKELVALCLFLMPDKFADFDTDVDIRAAARDPDQTKKIAELHTRLKPYMLRRLKKDVEKSLPLKSERILRVELSPLQVHYYKNVLTRNFSVLNRGVTGPGQLSLLNIMMELKKVSNHPFLFPNAEVVAKDPKDQLRSIILNSGKMLLLDKLLTRLKQGGHRVLIFSQMVRMLDIISDYLVFKNYSFQRLDGSVSSENRKKSIEQFNMPGSPDFCFILSTRAGGLGINLETADTVIIFDSDWNPQNDLQAMARAHRIGQKRQVSVYRFVSKGTVEEDILERAKRKMVLEYCIIKGMDTSGLNLEGVSKKNSDSGTGLSGSTGNAVGSTPFTKDELSAILKFGARNMFSESNDDQKTLDEMDLDKMLADAEQTETVAVGAAEDFLSQFQVADIGGSAFGMDSELSWNEIVPEGELEKLAEENRINLEDQLVWDSSRSRRRKRVVYTETGTRQLNSELGTNLSSDEGENDSRPRKRFVSSTAGTGNSVKKRSLGPGSVDKNNLSDKEVRALIRAILRFGDPRERPAEIIRDAELEDKSVDAINKVYDSIIVECNEAIAKNLETGKIDGNEVGDNDNSDEDVKQTSGKGETTHKRQSTKTIQVMYRGTIQVNAVVLTQRVSDLSVLTKKLSSGQFDSNHMKFRLGVPLKPVKNWSALWGQRDDSALLVGAFRHGFGNWEAIKSDKELGLENKMFLSPEDEAKLKLSLNSKASKSKSPKGLTRTPSQGVLAANGPIAPKASHLVRRGEYLLKVLSSLGESSYNETKKSKSASKGSRTSRRQRSRGQSTRKTDQAALSGNESKLDVGGSGVDGDGGKSSKNQSSVTPDVEEGEVSEYSSMDEHDCRDLLRPVRTFLRRLKEDAEKVETNKGKIKLIRECLLPVGRHIRSVYERRLSQSSDKSYRESVLKLLKHLWVYVAYHWNRPVGHKQLMQLFEKLDASNSSIAMSQASLNMGTSSSYNQTNSPSVGGMGMSPNPKSRNRNPGKSNSGSKGYRPSSDNYSRKRGNTRDSYAKSGSHYHSEKDSLSTSHTPGRSNGLGSGTSSGVISSMKLKFGATPDKKARVTSPSDRHHDSGRSPSYSHHHHHHHNYNQYTKSRDRDDSKRSNTHDEELSENMPVKEHSGTASNQTEIQTLIQVSKSEHENSTKKSEKSSIPSANPEVKAFGDAKKLDYYSDEDDFFNTSSPLSSP
ncbi:hypothetical protein BB559_005836 [Furculomyces boomerangus]|uniref:DNA helicase n=1 Tax=Furculomyces boomerangus TaxID=61424 RepID=A0A2T9Y6A8_9FUNG|nr:hypothetical protein BB559_005836 [Furculomyces boomerangus]